MSDDRRWLPPGADGQEGLRQGGQQGERGAENGQPGFGHPGFSEPGFAQPAYGARAPGGGAIPGGYGPPPGWTPPPKPGLIPLRPLGLGDVLGASFQVLRRNPRPTVGISLLWQGLVMLITIVLVGGVTALVAWRTSMATAADAETIGAGGIAALIVSAVVPMLLSIIAGALMQGIVSLEVARGTVGERLRFRGLWRMARGRAWALIGFVLLVMLAVTIALGIVAAIIAGLVIGLGEVGIALGVLLGLAGLFAALVIGAWLGTKLALVPSALMVEQLPLMAAVRRSWTLTNRYFWRTFGIILLVAVILGVASQIVTTPLSLAFGFFAPLLAVSEDPTVTIVLGVVLYLLLILLSLVVAAVTLVVQSATAALLYLDLRMRKEGLDLELQRFVEARQAGDASVADPLLTLPSEGARPTGSTSPWA